MRNYYIRDITWLYGKWGHLIIHGTEGRGGERARDIEKEQERERAKARERESKSERERERES